MTDGDNVRYWLCDHTSQTDVFSSLIVFVSQTSRYPSVVPSPLPSPPLPNRGKGYREGRARARTHWHWHYIHIYTWCRNVWRQAWIWYIVDRYCLTYAQLPSHHAGSSVGVSERTRMNDAVLCSSLMITAGADTLHRCIDADTVSQSITVAASGAPAHVGRVG